MPCSEPYLEDIVCHIYYDLKRELSMQENQTVFIDVPGLEWQWNPEHSHFTRLALQHPTPGWLHHIYWNSLIAESFQKQFWLRHIEDPKSKEDLPSLEVKKQTCFRKPFISGYTQNLPAPRLAIVLLEQWHVLLSCTDVTKCRCQISASTWVACYTPGWYMFSITDVFFRE